MKTVHLLIKGKVQGVFYRAAAKEKAEELQITGWIRNSEQGDVEATVTGEEDAVTQFINWCRTGPERAQVEDVLISEKPDQGFEHFQIIRY